MGYAVENCAGHARWNATLEAREWVLFVGKTSPAVAHTCPDAVLTDAALSMVQIAAVAEKRAKDAGATVDLVDAMMTDTGVVPSAVKTWWNARSSAEQDAFRGWLCVTPDVRAQAALDSL